MEVTAGFIAAIVTTQLIVYYYKLKHKNGETIY